MVVHARDLLDGSSAAFEVPFKTGWNCKLASVLDTVHHWFSTIFLVVSSGVVSESLIDDRERYPLSHG